PPRRAWRSTLCSIKTRSESPPMTSHHNKTWEEAAGTPETFVALPRLPQGLTFTENFPEPIRHDAERKRLIYRGFMCSASYTFLHGLSTDPAYVAALDALFQA